MNNQAETIHPVPPYQKVGGLHLGYHWSSSGNFLSMGSIMECPQKHLFLSSMISPWFPSHLPPERIRQETLYMVYFEMPKEKVFRIHEDYRSVVRGLRFHMIDDYRDEHVNTTPVDRLIESGYHFVSVYENDKNELPESFLLYPEQYVKHIIRYSGN